MYARLPSSVSLPRRRCLSFRRSKLSPPADGGADEREFRKDVGANACAKLEVVVKNAQAVLAHLPAGEKLRQFVGEVEPKLQAF